MAGVRKILIEGQEILEIDYSGAKESEMISLVEQAAEILEKENKPLLVMSIFSSNNYGTPAFMRTLEERIPKLEALILKQAVVGLDFTKKILLTGLNIFLQRNFKAFSTREEGLRYLLEKQPEESLPDHFKKRKS